MMHGPINIRFTVYGVSFNRVLFNDRRLMQTAVKNYFDAFRLKVSLPNLMEIISFCKI